MGNAYESVSVDRGNPADRIAQVTLIGPGKGNAMGPAFWSELPVVFAELDADPEVRAIVLTGSGRNFSYGLDLAAMGGTLSPMLADGALAKPRAEFHARLTAMQGAITAVADCRTPTIASVHGWCIGGGISVAVSCDLRYCSEQSQFGQPAMRYGIGYRYKSLRRLVDIIGVPASKDMLLGGLRFSAQEAYAKGLVGRVLGAAEFQPFIDDIAGKIAIGAPLTAQQVKYTLATILQDPDARDLDRCEEMFQTCYASKDYQEGIRAFAEKRKPVFKGE